MTERSFEECLREFRIRGVLARHPAGTPVLVRQGGEASAGHDGGFRTAFGRLEQTHPSALDVAAKPEPALGSVFLVLKKDGAPFPEQIGVGRAANTDVCLPLTTLSKYHAFFSVDGRGGYVVADAGSKNGSWLDGRRLVPRQPVPLGDGGKLRLGAHKFLFYTYAGFIRLLETQP
jgi:hypothetical protein